MYKFKHILVPTDFSEQFETAFSYAKELAASIGSTLHVIHVIEPAMIPADAAIYPDSKMIDVQTDIQKKAEGKMKDIEKNIDPEKMNLKTEILKGDPSETIVDYAEANEIDAICISTHSKTGLEKFIFGSVTEKVLRKAPCPVIAIRMPEHHKSEG